jgi:hypothetical protein
MGWIISSWEMGVDLTSCCWHFLKRQDSIFTSYLALPSYPQELDHQPLHNISTIHENRTHHRLLFTKEMWCTTLVCSPKCVQKAKSCFCPSQKIPRSHGSISQYNGGLCFLLLSLHKFTQICHHRMKFNWGWQSIHSKVVVQNDNTATQAKGQASSPSNIQFILLPVPKSREKSKKITGNIDLELAGCRCILLEAVHAVTLIFFFQPWKEWRSNELSSLVNSSGSCS